MAEKKQNPVERKSQQPDNQNKTTVERFNKQSLNTKVEKKEGDFTTGTISPEKHG